MLLVLAALATAALGHAELELIDGRVLGGTDVRREGAVYVLTLEGGGTISLPVELVASVRLFGKGDKREQPQTLAGDPIDLPTRSERLEVLGEPAGFQQGISDPTWAPKSDWDMDPVRQNNFAPSTWQKSPIDPSWKPTSDWDADDDVLASSRSTWQKSPIDSKWTPTDGFKDSVGRK